jgi:NAD(P)-dependent dehydrogenase (short-subunit alcohol dehydrogenase family)
MKEKYGPWALIAGGSEGIGEKFARYLAADGINLVLLARRAGPLEELASSVIAETGVEVRIITADLTKPDMLNLVRAQTDDLEVGMLIYNAGVDNRASDFVDRSLRGPDLAGASFRRADAEPQARRHYSGRLTAGLCRRRRHECVCGGESLQPYAGKRALV